MILDNFNLFDSRDIVKKIVFKGRNIMGKRTLCLILMLFYIIALSHSIELKKVKSFFLEQNQKIFIQEPHSFFVTDDDYIYLVDRQAANLKIFNNQGKLVKVIGRKGMGPYEFLNPCECAYYKNKVMISDFSRRNIFFYDRVDNNLVEQKNIMFLDIATDFKFINKNKLLIAGKTASIGPMKKSKSYSLYIYNIKNNKFNYLLTSAFCYGVKSEKQVNDAFDKFRYFSSDSLCDCFGDNLFYIQATKMRIIKLNLKNKKTKIFGKKTDNFIKPYISDKMKKAIAQRKNGLLDELEKSMSLVLELFCIDKNKLGLIYTKYNKKKNSQELFMQLYNPISGRFIKELPFYSSKTSYHTEMELFFQKSKNCLYIMDTILTDSSKIKFEINKFKITE